MSQISRYQCFSVFDLEMILFSDKHYLILDGLLLWFLRAIQLHSTCFIVSRMQSAMQFNVFRKPAVTKSKASRAPVPASASASQPTVDKYIVLDSESD